MLQAVQAFAVVSVIALARAQPLSVEELYQPDRFDDGKSTSRGQ
jgi:hypothetical protein